MDQPPQAPLQLPPYFQGHPTAGGPFFPYGNVASLEGYYGGSYPNQNYHPHFAPSSCVLPNAEFKTDEGVIVLAKDTYQKAVEEIPFLLVEFCKQTFFPST
jgi:hypothetical protein